MSVKPPTGPVCARCPVVLGVSCCEVKEGEHLATLTRAGACVFHEQGRGCGLPAEVRPVACRLYPFERWPDGGWSVQLSRYGDLAEARAGGGACLAVEEAERMEDVLAAFGTTRAEVEALGERLAEQTRAHGRG
jgi:Fe-S-cluster containining protein